MPLTPYDIHDKEFKRSFRGYDVDEVNDFLDQIIKEFEFLIREKQQLEQQVEELQAELERVMEEQSMTAPVPSREAQPAQPPQRYQDTQVTSATALTSMEQSIHKSIRVAQEVAEEVRLNAKKEAELIVQEAEKNADRIINEALQKARSIHSELLELKQKATIYRARFRTLVQSHLDILENSDWESLEELEEGLEEAGKQLEEYAEQQETAELEGGMDGFHTQEYESPVFEDEASYEMEEEDEPRRELRRTSRKLKKKAMF
ncbi:MAG: DivIVA domain-containing protein [Planifilum sp.]|jgi:cell division initiation protein